MADYKKLIPHVLKWEGGWSNDPDDNGGPTMKGVTLAVYTAYRTKKGLPAPSQKDLKNIIQEEWEDIFKNMYWDRWKADYINSQSVANLLVDWVWTSGVYGIKFAQRILKVVDDGLVGNKTLSAINNYPDQMILFKNLWERRKQHFTSIANSSPGNKKFLKGWLNRLNDLKWNG